MNGGPSLSSVLGPLLWALQIKHNRKPKELGAKRVEQTCCSEFESAVPRPEIDLWRLNPRYSRNVSVEFQLSGFLRHLWMAEGRRTLPRKICVLFWAVFFWPGARYSSL